MLRNIQWKIIVGIENRHAQTNHNARFYTFGLFYYFGSACDLENLQV